MATLDTTQQSMASGAIALPEAVDGFCERAAPFDLVKWHFQDPFVALVQRRMAISHKEDESEIEKPDAVEGRIVTLRHDEVSMERIRRHRGKVKIKVSDEDAERVAALLKGDVPAPE